MPIRTLQLSQAIRTSAETRRAALILRYAHGSAAAFLHAFRTVRQARQAAGTTSDEEQDLLRAMVVMVGAGLDSALKQLIRDSLPVLAELDESVREGLEKFVSRQVRGDVEDGTGGSSARFLARVLASTTPSERVIEEYVQFLTGSSLQSVDEVMRAASALGLEPRDLAIDVVALRHVFNVRNRIIHELDIDFDAARRNRASRTVALMTQHANTVLASCETVLRAVGERIAALRP